MRPRLTIFKDLVIISLMVVIKGACIILCFRCLMSRRQGSLGMIFYLCIIFKSKDCVQWHVEEVLESSMHKFKELCLTS